MITGLAHGTSDQELLAEYRGLVDNRVLEQLLPLEPALVGAAHAWEELLGIDTSFQTA